MSDTSEFSRMVDRRSLTAEPMVLEADDAERAALAKRFEIVAVESLKATLSLEADGEQVRASGQLEADIVQSCAVSGEDLSVQVREDLSLLFVPESSLAEAAPDEEIELAEEELDEIPYSGTAFDLGEAVAQSLALAIDPYAVGPQADEARQRHGLLEEGAAGPLAEALKGLKKD
ncbi:YceD family protein [Aurantiacibacter sp. MUD11]|uniref:YceD family protein n=1 Tax=Aurantiacibacter sp. MUD11 TaxID=3003265 RepID=UPI0022AA154E|nr:YceD family protein [Aurantiacibacter sp. MUD11]WAT17594.1 YceD family protein [Aurantiacibacter sp. MUD11]